MMKEENVVLLMLDACCFLRSSLDVSIWLLLQRVKAAPERKRAEFFF